MLNAFQGEEHQPFYYEGHNGAAALLVHGFPGSAAEMRPVAKLLHAEGWTTQGLLLPGFGPAIETLGEKSADDWQQAVANALHDLHRTHETVILVGNSMGGALSIHAAANTGADGLVLFAPFWKIDHFLWTALPVLRWVIPKFRPFQVFKPDFNDPEFRKGTRNFMPNVDFDNPAFQQQTLELEVDTRIFAAIRAAGASGYEAAPAVTAPVLVVQGTQDSLVSPALTQQLTARLAGDVTYLNVEADHNPLAPEAPYWGQVVEAVTQFSRRFKPITSPPSTPEE